MNYLKFFRKLLVVFLLSNPLYSFSNPTMDFTFHQDLVDAADQGNLMGVVEFIRQGNIVDGQGDFGATALMRACFRGNEEIVKLLLGIGANTEVKDDGGATALHFAAREGHSHIVNMLIKDGADVNAADKEGWTAIMKAAQSERLDAVRRLNKAGASLSTKNKWGNSAINYAVTGKNEKLVEYIVTTQEFHDLSNEEKEQLYVAAKARNNDEIIEILGQNVTIKPVSNLSSDIPKSLVVEANQMQSNISSKVDAEDAVNDFKDQETNFTAAEGADDFLVQQPNNMITGKPVVGSEVVITHQPSNIKPEDRSKAYDEIKMMQNSIADEVEVAKAAENSMPKVVAQEVDNWSKGQNIEQEPTGTGFFQSFASMFEDSDTYQEAEFGDVEVKDVPESTQPKVEEVIKSAKDVIKQSKPIDNTKIFVGLSEVDKELGLELACIDRAISEDDDILAAKAAKNSKTIEEELEADLKSLGEVLSESEGPIQNISFKPSSTKILRCAKHVNKAISSVEGGAIKNISVKITKSGNPTISKTLGYNVAGKVLDQTAIEGLCAEMEAKEGSYKIKSIMADIE